jgi:hypothetical protein
VAVFGCALTVMSMSPRAQVRPSLADYYAEMPTVTLDAGWAPLFKAGLTSTPDLDGDGNQDLIVLGAAYPINGNTDRRPQQGRVFLGDGNGRFMPAPASLYPVDTLLTVQPGHTFFDDFNGDGRPDMFIATSGWDVIGEHDEPNLLFLSQPEGGWRDATAALPQVQDFTHAAATGDISGRGVVDIFVGNGHPGKSQTRPYTLLNTGMGNFVQTTSNIPAGPNQLLDPLTAHRFVGATLADLNADGLPELIIGAHKSNTNQKLRRSLILWNRDGIFSETDVTQLPAAAVFEEFHEDYDIEPIDVDGDGLIDLVLTGEQPTYRGWFVQIIMNKGNRQFVDETAERMAPADSTRGVLGVTTAQPYGPKLNVLDFNQDGWPDFAVEWLAQGTPFTQDLPLVWINDGTGRFVTLKVRDFLVPGREAALGVQIHLMATANGYSFISPIYNTVTRTGGLRLTGVLATRPYRLVPTQ